MGLDTFNRRWLELDGFLAAYEAAQQRDRQADLAEFLPRPDHPLYQAVLCELIRLDLEYGWERGGPRPLDEYQRRFLELARDRESLRAVAFEEYRLRRYAGENPSPDEYRQRFGIDTEGWPGPLERGRAENLAGPSPAPRPSSPITLPEVGGEFLGFRLVAELGRGAFARVFLARQGDLGNRPVALKVGGDMVGEAETLVQLQHTNIVPVYSVHRAGLLQAICMPYFGATTLADVLRDLQGRASLPGSGKGLVDTLVRRHESTRLEREGPRGEVAVPEAPPGWESPEPAPTTAVPRGAHSTALREALERMPYGQAVLWMAARLADGLAHAHERGILHRDLKPANVLLTDEGQPMLLDFNLSEDTKPQSKASRAFVGGTLPYMAPEHLEALRGGSRPPPGVGGGTTPVDARSDLYSLGVILYELLTGRHPFPVRQGPLADVLTALDADRHGPPPGVRRWNKAVSPAVESIVRHCLEPDPARRYRTAGQLREDLQRHLEDLPLKHAPEPSWAERMRKWVRRHPRLTSWTSVGAMAGLVVLVLVTLFVLRGRRLTHLEALDSRRQLGEDLKTVHYLLNKPDAGREQHEEGFALCRRTAERYRLLDTPAWQETSLVRPLPPEERRHLREDVGELLFLWARAVAWEAAANPDPARRRDRVQFALQLNSRAEDCYAPDGAPRALGLQRARLTLLAGDEAEARRLREQAERAPLRTFRERYLLALHQMDQGRMRQAVAFLYEASRPDLHDFSVWLVLGNCHAAVGERGQAAAYYDIGTALWPASPWVYFNRGLFRLDNGDLGGAAADFDRAIELRPGLAEAYFNRSLARLRAGRPADALADLSHVLQTVEKPPTRVFFARARVKAQLGDHEGQRRDLEEGLRREPTDDNDCLARGVARYAGDPKGALADFERALTFNPLSRMALQNQASVLAEKLGRPADAIKVLDRLLALYPDSVLALAGRGVLHARLGVREAALRDARAALARDGSPATLYQVAGIYAQTSREQAGDRKEALRLLSAALEKGYGRDLLDKDRDLDPLRDHVEFRRLREASPASRGGARQAASGKEGK
jgi:serine/threonine protein kinase/tetratricopeptide (TPR) repeat protein